MLGRDNCRLRDRSATKFKGQSEFRGITGGLPRSARLRSRSVDVSGEMLPWSSLQKYWSAILTLCGVSAVAVVAMAQQAATEAPTGFDTPTLVENPGSQSVSNRIAQPTGDSFALDQQIFEFTSRRQ